MSDHLQELLSNLAGEGVRDSGGRFTLAAEKVSERYQSLLERNPELPWLRFLQYAYRVRARRVRCRMRTSECLLSLSGSLEVEEIAESLRRYPDPPNGDAAVLHQVVWLFLAQQPRSQKLTVARLQLEVGAKEFQLRENAERVEDDLQLVVAFHPVWLGFFQEASRRAAVQRELARRLPFFPGVLEWDGGLKPHPPRYAGRRRLVMAHLVNRDQADRIPHFACPEMDAWNTCHNLESMQNQPEADCDWLSLHYRGPADYELGADRWRARLLFVYCVNSDPGQLLPVRDGCLLEPQPLPGWPAGVKLMAACPPDLSCDASGLKLVQNEALEGFLNHLRQRYAEAIGELVRRFGCELATLGDLLAVG